MIALLQGFGLLAASASVFFIGLRSGMDEASARGAAFACVVIGNLALIVSNRSARHAIVQLLFIPNRAQWWVLAGASAALAAVLSTGVLQRIFHFAPLHADDLVTVAVAAMLAILWCESVKYWSRSTAG